MLKAGVKITKNTQSDATKWSCGLTPQHNVSGRWGEVQGNSSWKSAREEEFHPEEKIVSAHS